MSYDESAPRKRPAVAYGWLRHPEEDAPGMDAWELPDGLIIYVEKGQIPMLFTLDGKTYAG